MNHTGLARTRKGRGFRWNQRYLTLSSSGKLSYTLKPDSPFIRAQFDLVPGCAVTEIVHEKQVLGKRLYSFWIVWPDGKNAVRMEETDAYGEEEEEIVEEDLAERVRKDRSTKVKLKEKVEEQIERHHRYDNTVVSGLKVAGVALGGMLIGALTAGVGLVPYIAAAVGAATIAGGGAAAIRYRTPADSRLILAFETQADANIWRIKVENVLSSLVALRNAIPQQVDAEVVSRLIHASKQATGWKRIGTRNQVRLLELQGTNYCCRSQIVLPHSPVQSFLYLMERSPWPPSAGESGFEVLSQIDDHADIIRIDLIHHPYHHLWGQLLTMPKRRRHRTLVLTRFWKRDDDGIYVVTYNSHRDNVAAILDPAPTFSAVVTFSPPRGIHELENEEDEHSERRRESCLVIATVQTADSVDSPWLAGEAEALAESFLVSNTSDLDQSLQDSRYENQEEQETSGFESILFTHSRKPSAAKGRIVMTFQPGLEDESRLSKFPTPVSAQQQKIALTSPRKLRVISNQVHLLRGQLAVKEYALRRLMSRCSGTGMGKIDSKEAEVTEQLRLQFFELMREYQELTGKTYEQSRHDDIGGGTVVISRFQRAYTHSSTRSGDAVAETDDGLEMSLMGKSRRMIQHIKTDLCGRCPSHWKDLKSGDCALECRDSWLRVNKPNTIVWVLGTIFSVVAIRVLLVVF